VGQAVTGKKIHSGKQHNYGKESSDKMYFTTTILAIIVVITGIYIIRFAADLYTHRGKIRSEPGNAAILMGYTSFAQFLSSFGFPEFAFSTIFYRKLNIAEGVKLPGTLNTATTIPIAVVSMAYIYTINVDPLTLLVCIAAQTAGAFIGSRIVIGMNADRLRLFLGTALVATAFFIFAGNLGLVPAGGEAIGLAKDKLPGLAVFFLFIGAFCVMGFGATSLALAGLFAVGIHPAAALAIVMGASTFGCILGSMQFIRYGVYNRKVALISSCCGVIGVLLAVYVVKNMDIRALQWIIAVVILYSGIIMLTSGCEIGNNTSME
jgi:uncharacterized membrane protein YfcA